MCLQHPVSGRTMVLHWVGETAAEGTGLLLIATQTFYQMLGDNRSLGMNLCPPSGKTQELIFTALVLSLKPEKQLQKVSHLSVCVLPYVPSIGPQRSQQGHNFHFRPDRQAERFGESFESSQKQWQNKTLCHWIWESSSYGGTEAGMVKGRWH